MRRLNLFCALLLLTLACEAPRSTAPAVASAPLVTHEVSAVDQGDARLTVLLHGYGSNEKDLLGLTAPLGLSGPIVSYRAPETAGHGYGWFPIEFTPEGTRYPPDAADAALDRLAAQLRQLRSERKDPVVVVGYSQGAMMAMLLAAEHPDTLDAAIAFSGALPRKPAVANSPAPVFMGHGTADPVVPVERARTARSWLETAGVDVQLYEVEGLQHQTSAVALQRARDWLSAHCSPSNCGSRLE